MAHANITSISQCWAHPMPNCFPHPTVAQCGAIVHVIKIPSLGTWETVTHPRLVHLLCGVMIAGTILSCAAEHLRRALASDTQQRQRCRQACAHLSHTSRDGCERPILAREAELQLGQLRVAGDGLVAAAGRCSRGAQAQRSKAFQGRQPV
jgi:hypothetical protein